MTMHCQERFGTACPEKVDAALVGFFRTEHLVALRELALRFVADETEEELLAYLETHRQGTTWDTSERIMVAVSSAPGTPGVVRRAARIAARVKAELHVVHVASDAAPPGVQRGVAEVRSLAADVGATWHEVVGEDLARTLVGFAAEHQITQIVLGSSRRKRLEELTRGSVVSRVLRFAADKGVDVHVIARRESVDARDGGPAAQPGGS